MTTVQRLAVDLHDYLCHENNTGGCGFGYELKDGEHYWFAEEHSIWLEKAENALEILNDPEKIMKIVKAIK